MKITVGSVISTRETSAYVHIALLGKIIKIKNFSLLDKVKKPKKKKKSKHNSEIAKILKDNKDLLKGSSSSIFKLLKRCLKKIKIKTLEVSASIGLDDAAATALVVGALYTLAGSAVEILMSLLKTEKVKLSIVPKYGEMIFLAEILCILEVKFVHIIYAALRIFWLGLKMTIKLLIRKHKNKLKLKGNVQYG